MSDTLVAQDEAAVERPSGGNLGDPSESGKRGAAVREANWLARATQTRQELATLHDRATGRVGEALDAVAPDIVVERPDGTTITHGGAPDHRIRLQAATMIFDRTGVAPTQQHDIVVSGTWLDQMLRPVVDVEAVDDE